MPIDPNAPKSEIFHELRHGKGYAATRRKHGKKKAQQQMVARYFKAKRGEGGKRKSRARHSGR